MQGLPESSRWTPFRLPNWQIAEPWIRHHIQPPAQQGLSQRQTVRFELSASFSPSLESHVVKRDPSSTRNEFGAPNTKPVTDLSAIQTEDAFSHTRKTCHRHRRLSLLKPAWRRVVVQFTKAGQDGVCPYGDSLVSIQLSDGGRFGRCDLIVSPSRAAKNRVSESRRFSRRAASSDILLTIWSVLCGS